ncbi:pilin [Undibacterium fentianense]|uniref:Pilin n=1 Tax=Undibacterium fentianense TaxID=2828728 RepID=A0A941DYF0_9BURK|nr:pilin [Undibacterium fentianense]MBR7799055.1 pilin [Undibacterium fentianense]
MKKILGFSLLEAMVAVAIIAILAAMALPSYLFKIIREQIETAIPLIEIAKTPIANSWRSDKILLADNAAAMLPPPDKIVNNFVKSVTIENGAIHIKFGNRANKAIQNKILTFRPAVIDDAQVVPITWVCANAGAPDKMTLKGTDRTNIDPQNLPLICRPRDKTQSNN